MKKWDDLVEYLQDKNLVSSDILSKYCAKNELKTENEKKANTLRQWQPSRMQYTAT